MREVLRSLWCRRPVRVVGVTVLAALATLFFFSPRFVYWRGFDIPFKTSEVARANAALEQLREPLKRFDDHTNRVMGHRLFFPLLGHALHLPPSFYLALPHLGCLAVLGFVAWLLQRHGFSARQSLAAAVLLGTTSWFFVSTGWLGYFDAWYVLALLVVAFARSGRFSTVAILIAPWIDERFVMTLPLALAIRVCYLGAFEQPTGDRRHVRMSLLQLTGLIPWLAYRGAVFVAGSDSVTAGYFGDMPAYMAAIPVSHYALGIWHGIRWGWLFVFIALIYSTPTSAKARVAFGVLFAVTFTANLLIAEDVSRSVSATIPLALLGILLWSKHRPASLAPALFAACALNLLFPAIHVSAKEVWPIRYLYAEWDRLSDPPRLVDPRFWNEQGVAWSNRGDIQKACDFLTCAIQLDENYAEAHANRAVMQYKLGHRPEAMNDIEQALALSPENPDYLHARGSMRGEAGDISGAIKDFEVALMRAPTDWQLREQVTRMLDGLRGKNTPP